MHNRHNHSNTLKLSFFLALLLLLPLGAWIFQTIDADPLASAPVLHQGRYRPLEALFQKTEEQLAPKSAADPSWLLMLEIMDWQRFQNLKVVDFKKLNREETSLTPKEVVSLFEEDLNFAEEALPAVILKFLKDEKLPYQTGGPINLNSLAPGLSVKFIHESPSPSFFIHKASKEKGWNRLARGETIKMPLLAGDGESQQETYRLYRLYQLFTVKRAQDLTPGNASGETLLGMRVIPGKKPSDSWLPLSIALSDKESSLQKPVLALADSFGTAAFQEKRNALGDALLDGYRDFLKNAKGSFPTPLQLKAEVFYLKYDLLGLTALLYFVAASAMAVALKWERALKFGIFAFSLALTINALLLGLRIYILERPPVSNMLESLLFVPMVAALVSLFLTRSLPSNLPLIGGAAIAAAILAVTRLAFPESNLENAPAVLNSRFWLIIHVLMVVSSYAFFLIASAIAHVDLWISSNRIKSGLATSLSSLILIVLYAGTFLLISGTILGGVWAQQSWGRFWDWDPKESWAFISSCLYLILIHLYRFGLIREAGLSKGAIFGALLIGFTWYGVNYLLGTGLHSYGFGSGGSEWYIAFCLTELLFIGLVSLRERAAA